MTIWPRERLAARLRELLPARYVLTRPEELLAYEYDGSHLDLALPHIVVAPSTTEEVAGVVRAAHEAGWPIVPRGGGTGLSGGAVAAAGGLVLATSRMSRVLSVDAASRTAVVQPGVINLELSQQLAATGLHFAPDPSSQKASTIGGNLGTNAGGPHCLKYGITSSHIVGAKLVLFDGTTIEVGGAAPDAPGYDLLGVVVGSEGTLGVVTEITVRLTPNPEAVRTFLAVYDELDGASRTVSAIIAAGVIPAALEMLVGPGIRVVEESVHAGYPVDATAVLLIECDGLREELDGQARRIIEICEEFGAREIKDAQDEAQRAKLWAGRKGVAGAMARLNPHYHILDGTIPRSRLPELLAYSEEVAARYELTIVNVFHAGDGNLHPLLSFDARIPGTIERAVKASEEILRACVAAGGSISGEHGVGIEKRDYMGMMYSETDLAVMQELRDAFDPRGMMNPCKSLPTGHSCADIRTAIGAQRAVAGGAWI
jgi:glycolate oxidase